MCCVAPDTRIYRSVPPCFVNFEIRRELCKMLQKCQVPQVEWFVDVVKPTNILVPANFTRIIEFYRCRHSYANTLDSK